MSVAQSFFILKRSDSSLNLIAQICWYIILLLWGRIWISSMIEQLAHWLVQLTYDTHREITFNRYPKVLHYRVTLHWKPISVSGMIPIMTKCCNMLQTLLLHGIANISWASGLFLIKCDNAECFPRRACAYPGDYHHIILSSVDCTWLI